MVRLNSYLILIVFSFWLSACGETKFSVDRVQADQVKASDVVDTETPRTPEEQERIDSEVERNICDKHGKKVRICHIPPGNPDNRHTICIGRSALPAHVGRHGVDDDHDYVGSCDGDDDDDDDDDCDDDDDEENP